ncbi:MAG: hypothetical protein ACM3MN_10675, partial [Nitrospirota bacterium]
RAFRLGGGERLNQEGGISPRSMGNFPYGLFSDLGVGCECSFFHKFYELLVRDLTYRNQKTLWHQQGYLITPGHKTTIKPGKEVKKRKRLRSRGVRNRYKREFLGIV